ncbi:nucleotide exchange factor GrpE [Methanocella arvoryzae]|uniref:Protein GrpE n=1 Tax=Methanocella arvoryzae (strain DSM 22066 / NBRC 105507 / MRE50) TaxID=351160 RepID=Q0W873_METAR|nr:nucleotide exchange factor GrpE [Methanocella arvoryzae]CAJ35420.1 DnaK co-chaperonin (Hsp70 cofactor) [Methanocella arvoryzae MRE50]
MDSKSVPGGDESEKINRQEQATAEEPNEGDEVARLTRQVEEYLTGLRYLQADFENYKKRVAREKEDVVRYANEGLILELIDAYENMERAVANAKKSGDGQMAKGLEMIYAQMSATLSRHGLKPIEAVGKKFDPRLHEAMMQEASEDVEEGTILDEFQRGYMLHSKVIRCAKVKVSKR